MVEKKCEKNLEKSERVSVKRRYKMKTLNGHTKEPEPDLGQCQFYGNLKMWPDRRILVQRQFST